MPFSGHNQNKVAPSLCGATLYKSFFFEFFRARKTILSEFINKKEDKLIAYINCLLYNCTAFS